ncbi:MAG: 5-formyltetrahydrofolate cyclo-ligase [Clostridiales bacterium]|nr:5-formyltetrahydrofolate cyclo-ligase [Clostridiales bacterium]
MDVKEEKAGIRKEILRRRSAIPSKTLAEIDKSLPDFIAGIEDPELQSRLRKAKRIALYRAYKGEVPVDGLAGSFMEKGIRCCFPRIENGNMIFFDCESLSDDEFEESPKGIKEPVLSATKADSIDVVVLPAVAYNEEGVRLGMGGGYYDRYFGGRDNDRPYLLGICYEFQICSGVPVTDHDICADFIAVIPEEMYGE